MISPSLLAQFAAEALLEEVHLFPKPGLVDPISNGAHEDMTLDTFYQSVEALRPFLLEYAEAGASHAGTPIELFDKLRAIGQAAEDAMLAATGGVNTHKGANFSFAILLGAFAQCNGNEAERFAYASQLTAHLLEADFKDLEKKKTLSYGERLYVEHGITGIRGEAAMGYPSLQQALTAYRSNPIADETFRRLQLLLLLMSIVEDGNLIHRGGLEAYQTVKEESRMLYDKSPYLTKPALFQQLTAYDETLIKRHLSPGGSADLLSLAFFCEKVAQYEWKQTKDE